MSLTENEARRVMSGGLGRAELEFATSICAPLLWIVRDADGSKRIRSGTAFFLDAGTGVFGVTAEHVIAGLEKSVETETVESVQLGRDLTLDLRGANAIIDRNADMDIATFRVSLAEVTSLKKTVLTGSQGSWPPVPPEVGRGIYFSGFVAAESCWLSPTEISMGAAPGSGVAENVGRRDVVLQFDRSRWIDVMGLGLPPERYNFGGISGGPMLAVIERNGLRSWSLAGVIYQGPNSPEVEGKFIPGWETITARHAKFIRTDGMLEHSLWEYPTAV